mmetsp:Transcript_23890/g.58392  ORF Transcript_23890/g.58392 Transcript_23890/m.58392 type:complete len:83 (-) Transcript_23890:1059-1307(-)
MTMLFVGSFLLNGEMKRFLVSHHHTYKVPRQWCSTLTVSPFSVGVVMQCFTLGKKPGSVLYCGQDEFTIEPTSTQTWTLIPT